MVREVPSSASARTTTAAVAMEPLGLVGSKRARDPAPAPAPAPALAPEDVTLAGAAGAEAQAGAAANAVLAGAAADAALAGAAAAAAAAAAEEPRRAPRCMPQWGDAEFFERDVVPRIVVAGWALDLAPLVHTSKIFREVPRLRMAGGGERNDTMSWLLWRATQSMAALTAGGARRTELWYEHQPSAKFMLWPELRYRAAIARRNYATIALFEAAGVAPLMCGRCPPEEQERATEICRLCDGDGRSCDDKSNRSRLCWSCADYEWAACDTCKIRACSACARGWPYCTECDHVDCEQCARRNDNPFCKCGRSFCASCARKEEFSYCSGGHCMLTRDSLGCICSICAQVESPFETCDTCCFSFCEPCARDKFETCDACQLSRCIDCAPGFISCDCSEENARYCSTSCAEEAGLIACDMCDVLRCEHCARGTFANGSAEGEGEDERGEVEGEEKRAEDEGGSEHESEGASEHEAEGESEREGERTDASGEIVLAGAEDAGTCSASERALVMCDSCDAALCSTCLKSEQGAVAFIFCGACDSARCIPCMRTESPHFVCCDTCGALRCPDCFPDEPCADCGEFLCEHCEHTCAFEAHVGTA